MTVTAEELADARCRRCGRLKGKNTGQPPYRCVCAPTSDPAQVRMDDLRMARMEAFIEAWLGLGKWE